MSGIIIRRPRAKLDLIEQVVFLEEQSRDSELSTLFLDAFESAIDQIAVWPR